MAETFVLVHGAWHGGWAWRPVGARLEAAGHVVHAPTCRASAFMQDASPETQELVHSLLAPHPFATLTDPAPDVDYAALRVPLAYVGSRDDRAMLAPDSPWPPPFASRLPDGSFAEIGGSHLSILTRPAEVAAAVLSLTDNR
ncbi:alpha/beta hydrolase [Sinomonas flava]|uniref:alpha/beta fold hydrolase n=1 Tax=Sinomonas flava TaxID=496857 RepID=UPI0039A4BD72